MVFNGTSWIDGSWSFTGDVYQSGSFVELRVPLAKLGNPSTVRVHLNMVNESNGGEWTYAGVPSTSFQDGLDPDYGKFFSFDLTSAKAPKDYLPQ